MTKHTQRRLRGWSLACSFLMIQGVAPTSSVAASAQTPASAGAVEGIVRDVSGAPLAGTRVELTGNGPARAVLADAAGHYRFDSVPPGTYRVVGGHTNLAPVAHDVVVSNAIVTVDLTFRDVTTSETVSVAGGETRATLDTPSAAASRLGLSARETPATVTTMTFAEAQERGLGTTTEALTRVPGVSAANFPATFATSMRGFTAAAVSALYDGTRITTSSMVMRNFDSWNFDRIEVLKGPASVLYGEGALAGAVNFVTKRPDFSRRHSEALVSFGSLRNGRAALGTTGPIGNGERAAYRADVVFSGSGGYVDDTDTRAVNFSGAVDVKLTPAVTLSLSADHFRDDYSTAYWGTPLVSPSIARDPSDVVTDSRGLVLDKSLRDINYEANDAVLQSHSTWVRARLDWRLSSAWRLVNEAYGYDALRDWRTFDTVGFDTARNLVTRTPSSITHDHQFYGNRLLLASDSRFGGRRNRLSIGVEANRNEFFMPRRFGGPSTIDPFMPDRGTFPAETPANFPGAGNFIDATTNLTLVSVFAEDAFSLLPNVTVISGGRYDQFDVDRRNVDYNTGLTDTYSHVFEPFSGRVGVVVDGRATRRCLGSTRRPSRPCRPSQPSRGRTRVSI